MANESLIEKLEAEIVDYPTPANIERQRELVRQLRTPDSSLVEKLEAERDASKAPTFRAGIDTAIAIVRDHFAEAGKMVQSEIPENENQPLPEGRGAGHAGADSNTDSDVAQQPDAGEVRVMGDGATGNDARPPEGGFSSSPTSPSGQPDDLSYEVRERARQAIQDHILSTQTESWDALAAVLEVLRPYLRMPERESVERAEAVESIAQAIADYQFKHLDNNSDVLAEIAYQAIEKSKKSPEQKP